MFENILNIVAPIKIGEPTSKSTKKKWLSREILNLINEKHRLFNIWKEKRDVDTYNSYKRIRNHTNRLLEERVTIIHRNCSKVYPIQSNSGNSLKQR